jgi:uncharacterized phiE125 gp8 family phage protein
MSSILLTGPAIEPLSLDEAKAFLRVEHSDDDQIISALIAGARTHIETQSQVALITQGWRIVLDCWPQHGRIVVRPGPLKSLHAARFYDLNGNAHAIDTQGFVPDYGGSVLAFVPWAVPMLGRATYGVNSGIGRSGKVLRRVLGLPDNTSVVTDQVVAAAGDQSQDFDCRYL